MRTEYCAYSVLIIVHTEYCAYILWVTADDYYAYSVLCVHPMRYRRWLCVQSIVRTAYWLLYIQSIVRTSYELPQMIIVRTAYCAYILCVTADYCAYRVLCVQRIDCCAYVTEYCAYILCVTVYWLLCVQSIERTEYWLSCVHYRLLCVRLVKSKCARVLIRYCAYITEYCVYFG